MHKTSSWDERSCGYRHRSARVGVELVPQAMALADVLGAVVMAFRDDGDHDRPMFEATLRLRDCLQTSLQKCRDASFLLIEDTLTAQFYRLGTREWRFVSLLDGTRNVKQAWDKSRCPENHEGLSHDEVLALCGWLMGNQLVTVITPDGHPYPAMEMPKTVAKRWSLFFVRIPLMNPDRFFKFVLPWFRWALTPLALLVWLLLCLIGTACVVDNFGRFVRSTETIVDPRKWHLLLISWLILKLIHELFHGLVCKKYGGNITSTGIAFIIFSPVAFVDVTSAWRFRWKWQRVFTAAAGMYAELGVAAICAILWSRQAPGLVSELLHGIILMASVSTILFNANPLVRFDGYYILTDFLQLQTLDIDARRAVHSLVGRMLGWPGLSTHWSRAYFVFVTLYGIGTMMWKVVVTMSITVLMASVFKGAGFFVAALMLLVWFVVPAIRLVKQFSQQSLSRVDPYRWLAGATVGMAALGVVLLVPLPKRIVVPGVVDYHDDSIARVKTSGFVAELFVESGSTVREGQRLARLENKPLVASLADMDLQIQQSLIRSRLLQSQGKLSTDQLEVESRIALQRRQQQLRSKVDDLVIRATHAGQVTSRNLPMLLGTYLEEGNILMGIAAASQQEIQLSVDGDDISQLAASFGKEARIRLRRRARCLRGSLESICPGASDVVPHAALSASNNGPIAVQTNDEDPSQSRMHRFITPRFIAIVKFPARQAEQLFAGELADVAFTVHHRSIGQAVSRSARDWLDRLN